MLKYSSVNREYTLSRKARIKGDILLVLKHVAILLYTCINFKTCGDTVIHMY